MGTGGLKRVDWIATSGKNIRAMPEAVRSVFGYALFLAQRGDKRPDAKPLKGFGGAGVLEVVENHDGDTFRAVYTVRFEEAVYVLHCFQKKSRSGVSTPKRDIDLIKSRLKVAQEEHRKWQTKQK